MSRPTITVGIPCYNHAEYLPDCIESVLTQTDRPDEIIFVNDGSTDKSLEIARLYEKKGVKIIDQVNKGLASARNTVIMNSTSDYILPLDSDDILMDNCIEKLRETIQQTNADVIGLSFKCFGVENTTVILHKDPKVNDFLKFNMIPYCSAFKRSVALEVGGYSPRMTWGYEDLHFWVDILKRGKILVTIPEVMFLYRTKTKSMIHEAQAHHQELMDQIFKDHKNNLVVTNENK